ncbi:MAG: DUF4900 domain-containing protein [Candidatus Omnitrophica bacterium]|nr:DUF4900 domain-containing protein [Candidatus Omnitrophota bacterium]
MRSERGAILGLVMVCIMAFTMLGLGAVYFSGAQSQAAQMRIASIQAFWAAEGGAQAGVYKLNDLINVHLRNYINNSTADNVKNFASSKVTSKDGIGWLIGSVVDGGTQLLTKTGSTATYAINSTSIGNGPTYQGTIVISQTVNPQTIVTNASWRFFYNYALQLTGTASGVKKKIQLSGVFTVNVQYDNFARYALFVNNNTLPDGTLVWFANSTTFSGPLQTNGQYNFWGKPVFYGEVTQHNSSANFYNNGHQVSLNSDHNGTIDVPTFSQGFVRGAATVDPSQSPIKEQDIIDQSTGKTKLNGNGTFVPNDGTKLIGGIYVNGNADNVLLGVDAQGQATYQITQGKTTSTITVNTANKTTTFNDGKTSKTYNGIPDGISHSGTILYVNGQITALSGTVQKDSAVTISTKNDILINNNIQYQQRTAAKGTPGTTGYVAATADGFNNMLGILSWEGNVRIPTSAPNNLNIDGIVMAPIGVFSVDNYNSGSPRGTVNILGGVISNYYGAFGTSDDGKTMKTGYGRNFSYDDRTLLGNIPPYFPGLNTFAAFTTDIRDQVAWQEGGF